MKLTTQEFGNVVSRNSFLPLRDNEGILLTPTWADDPHSTVSLPAPSAMAAAAHRA
jgi:hypothetical protein